MKKTLWEKFEAQFAELKNLLTASAAKPGDAEAKAAADKAITTFRSELDTAKKDVEASEKTISDLTAKVAELNKSIEGKDKEITDLKAAAKTAGEQAADMLASAGIDPDRLPKLEAPKAGEGEKKSLRAQYEALLATDSVKAAEFYAMHRDKKDFWS